MRAIITGERDWPSETQVWDTLDRWFSSASDLTIVHGDCETGVDAFAKAWAIARGNREESHPALSNGRTWPSAGPIRNREMARDPRGASMCGAFWSGRVSKSGTHNMIVEATLAGIPVRIVPKEGK